VVNRDEILHQKQYGTFQVLHNIISKTIRGYNISFFTLSAYHLVSMNSCTMVSFLYTSRH